MKKVLSIILSLCMLLSITAGLDLSANAQSLQDYFYYWILGDLALINACDKNISGDVIIPATLEGYPVSIIGDDAFSDCTKITSVTIPDCVTRINQGAFSCCTNLTSVNMGSGVRYIGDEAFEGCINLTDVYYNGTPPQWNRINIRYDNESLTEATIHFDYTTVAEEISAGETKTAVISNEWDVVYFKFIPEESGYYAFFSSSDNDEHYKNGCLYDADMNMLADDYDGDDYNFSISYYCEADVTYILSAEYDSDTTGSFDVTVVLDNLILDEETGYAYRVIDDEAVIAGYDGEISGDITIPNTIGGYPVTSIGDNAFFECAGLTSVIIPDGVTSIGDYAFNGCEGLTGITIPASVTSIGYYVLVGCTSLASINVDSNNQYYTSEYGVLFDKLKTTLIQYPAADARDIYYIPGCVSSISGGAFCACSNLTNITIPNSVTSIPMGAFMECTGLITIGIPNTVTSIGEFAFFGCSSLTTITIPDGVSVIPANAFSECTGLTSVTIGNNVTIIEMAAFYGCESLTSVTIPDSVTTIGDGAFLACSNLTSINIGSGVAYIGDTAFYACQSLTDVYYNGTQYEWSRIEIFEYSEPFTSATIHYMEEGNTPDEPTLDEETGYFYRVLDGEAAVTGYNGSISDITIPATLGGYRVTRIGHDAFMECRNLTSVIIPDGVTYIGWCAFSDCTSLTSITIPNSVTSIGNWAFYNCTSLTDVYYNGTQDEWSRLRLETGDDNDPLIEATIHFVESHEHSYSTVVTDPTCTERGYTTYTCDCGDTYVDDYTDPVGHTYGEYIYNEDAVYVSSSEHSDGTATATCSLCGAKDTKTIAGTGLLRANGATVTLGAAVELNVRFAYSRQEAFDRTYLVITYAGRDYVLDDGDTRPYNDTTFQYNFDKITPETFGDTVVLTMYGVKDGIVCKGHSVDYSIKQYATNTLKNSDTALSKLLVEMLYYAEAAQNYYYYKTDAPLTANLTDEQRALHGNDVPEYNSVTNPNYVVLDNAESVWIAATMELEGKVIPKFKFRIPESDDIQDYAIRFSIGGKTVDVSYAEHPELFEPTTTTTGGYKAYFVRCTILDAEQFSDPIDAQVIKNGNVTSNTLRYSVESYATSNTYKNGTQNLKNLVDQILRYGRAAKQYIASR